MDDFKKEIDEIILDHLLCALHEIEKYSKEQKLLISATCNSWNYRVENSKESFND
tara:strand:+ start:1148 stop:1312 length:165 start_codon:yes stop_codon:yes gene_type:complete